MDRKIEFLCVDIKPAFFSGIFILKIKNSKGPQHIIDHKRNGAVAGEKPLCPYLCDLLPFRRNLAPGCFRPATSGHGAGFQLTCKSSCSRLSYLEAKAVAKVLSACATVGGCGRAAVAKVV
jgi:hypothetical protein